MSTVQRRALPLVAGDKLSRREFMRRWEAMPEVKRAELIGGVVYTPSPVSVDHGDTDIDVAAWLRWYALHTPGCKAGSNATWFMLRDAPQPDVHLRILPELGGAHRIKGKYLVGAPELAAEVCISSASYDLHQKMDLYQAAGVQEYVAVLMTEKQVRWHRLEAGSYKRLTTSRDGVIRSVVFPGLWLNAPAVLEGNMAEVVATLNRGLASPAHEEFVARLAERSRRRP